jgi:hypothetical protein
MFGRKGVTWVLAASVFWLSACGRVHEPEKSLPTETSLSPEKSEQPETSLPPEKNAESPASVQQITLHVPGMIDRQGIT